MIQKRRPKLLLFSKFSKKKGDDEEDAGIIAVLNDRIPSVLIVRWFDLFCFCFAMVSYVMDVFSDIGIACMHFYAGRPTSGFLVLTFALIPSIIINVISFIWMLDDEMHWKRRAHPRRIVTIELEQKRFCSIPTLAFLCAIQMGPLFWYYKAFHYGFRFRNKSNNPGDKRKNFSKMVEAERDATLLRFFEAYLESAPQMIVQGTILGNFVWNNWSEKMPFWAYFQALSLTISLVSISWSVVVQNRSLRMIRDDKVNIWPHEAILQFCWRFTTIVSRVTVLCLSVLFFQFNILLALFVHLLVTLVHVVFLQAIHMEECTAVEKLLLMINTFIHIFTPFNMAEGPTRYRYLAAYSIEFLEMLLLIVFLPTTAESFPFIDYIRVALPTLFAIGISIMCVYYMWFHPNRRQLQENETEPDAEQSENTAENALIAAECTTDTLKMAGCVMNVINECVFD